jgi:hypothetical protein
MPIPNELSYSNEDEFSQQFLIPLLRRLGFSVVANYHGHAEFGKDLVFAEIDRFGHVRYHAIQSKYLPSISLNAIEDLVLDCKQAFNNPFTHPQTGAVERISTFYAVNAGTIGPEATQHFFQSLVGVYGGNVRLLQARDLLVLNQWATAQRHEQIVDRLTGLLLELRFNRRQIQAITNNYKTSLDNQKAPLIFTAIRTNAVSQYLSAPILVDEVSADILEAYWQSCSVLEAWISVHRMWRIKPDDDRAASEASLLGMTSRIEKFAVAIESQIQSVVVRLGPLQQNQHPQRANHPMQPSGEVGRFDVDDRPSPPADW